MVQSTCCGCPLQREIKWVRTCGLVGNVCVYTYISTYYILACNIPGTEISIVYVVNWLSCFEQNMSMFTC